MLLLCHHSFPVGALIEQTILSNNLNRSQSRTCHDVFSFGLLSGCRGDHWRRASQLGDSATQQEDQNRRLWHERSRQILRPERRPTRHHRRSVDCRHLKSLCSSRYNNAPHRSDQPKTTSLYFCIEPVHMTRPT